MEQLIYSVSNHKVLAAIIAFITIAIETFLPLLPLIAIVLANSFVLGMWLGFLVSWIGSSISSIILYYFANKFSRLKFIRRYQKNEKILNIIKWIQKQGFNFIFISYACPFIPDFLITIASGFASVNIKDFILGMISGKFVMFLLISYVGDDITELLNNPIKIILLSFVVMLSWLVGQNINKKISKDNYVEYE